MIYSSREAHSIEEIPLTMTVADLIGFLEWCNPEAPVYVEGYDGQLVNGLYIDASIEEVDE